MLLSTRQTQFEIHQIGGRAPGVQTIGELSYREQPVERWTATLQIGPEDETVWATVDEAQRLVPAGPGERPLAGFRVVPRTLNPVLAMIVRGDHVLVDALPALPLSILTVKSSVVLSPDCRCFVTKRIRPYVGPPTPEMAAQRLKCSFCGIPITDQPDPEHGLVTRIVTHECGAVYHFETAESHPGVPPADLLMCREKVRNCLVCPRPVTTEDYLAWAPAADPRLVRV